MGLSFFVLASIVVPVLKLFLSSAVLEKILEISSVLGATNVNIYPFAILLIIFPLTLIEVSFRTAPNTVTIFFAFFPFSLKTLPIGPFKSSLPVSLSMLK